MDGVWTRCFVGSLGACGRTEDARRRCARTGPALSHSRTLAVPRAAKTQIIILIIMI